MDLPDLLLLQGLTEQMSRARIDRYAAGRVGSARAAEIHALFADMEERPERPATPVGNALAMPRSQPLFGRRDDLAVLMTSAAMGAAIERGHADLNALLATDEFVSLSEAAKRCGVSEQTVRTRVKAGKLFGVSGPGGSRSKYCICRHLAPDPGALAWRSFPPQNRRTDQRHPAHAVKMVATYVAEQSRGRRRHIVMVGDIPRILQEMT